MYYCVFNVRVSQWSLCPFQAVEKFSANTSQVGSTLRDLCERLQHTEFPNDVASTAGLIREHTDAYQQTRGDLADTLRHGDVLRGCFKTVRQPDGPPTELPSAQLPPSKLAHVTAVERWVLTLIAGADSL